MFRLEPLLRFRAVWGLACFGLFLVGCHSRDRDIPHETEKEFIPMAFDKTFADLGDTPSRIQYDFSFQNVSEATIDRISFSSTCGCSVAQIEPKTIPPGASGKVTVEIDQSNKGKGPQTYMVFVHYETNEKYRQRLVVKTKNGTGVTCVPERFDIETWSREPIVRNLCLWDSRTVPLRIKEIKTSAPWIRCEPADPPREFFEEKRFTYHVMIDVDSIPSGKNEGYLEILTEDPQYPRFEIPILCRIQPSILVIPERVAMVKDVDQVKWTGRFLVRHREGLPVVLRVESESPEKSLDYAVNTEEDADAEVSLAIDSETERYHPLPWTLKLLVEKPCREEIEFTLLSESP